MNAGEKLLNYWGGMMISGSIHLGDKLGLYKQLAKTQAVTREEFATITQLNERYLREWLEGQVAAGILNYDFSTKKFSLPDDMAELLADENRPSFMAGIFSQMLPLSKALEQLPECFKHGGGITFDDLGPHIHNLRFFDAWYKTIFIDTVLPALEDNVTNKLKQGIKVADIGCGNGTAILALAEKFPASNFYGYEISKNALAQAQEKLKQTPLTNVFFCDVSHQAINQDHSFDLICTFDCLHDMTKPQEVINSIYHALKPDGTWFVADLNTENSFEANLTNNPLAKYLYACSIACCLPSSLSEPNGAGLGTLGFSEEVARKMAQIPGFTRFKRHDFNNPFNSYFELRP